MSDHSRVIFVLRKPESMTVTSLGNLLGLKTRRKILSIDEAPNKLHLRVEFDGEVNISELSRICQYHHVLIMPELIETTVIHVNKEWSNMLMSCGVKLDRIFKPGIQISQSKGTLVLKGEPVDIEEAIDTIEKTVLLKLARLPVEGKKDYDDYDEKKVIVSSTDRDLTVQSQSNKGDKESEQSQRIEVQENVWNYIKFRYEKLWAHWNELYSPRNIADGGHSLVELIGNPSSIKEFVEFYNKEHLDTVITMLLAIPNGMHEIKKLKRIGDNCSKVSISWRDSKHLELTGLHYEVLQSLNQLEHFFEAHGQKRQETIIQLQSQSVDLNAGAGSTDAAVPDEPSTGLASPTHHIKSTAVDPANAKAAPVPYSDRMEFDTKLSSLKVAILRGDLTQLRSDAIVNAANSSLLHKGGVALAIASAAGDELLHECKVHIKEYGKLQVSEVMHSTSGLLSNRVKYVIHAVGPIYAHTNGPRDCQNLLEKTFYNCFMYANDTLRTRSLAVPAISSGIFGVPWNIVGIATYNALMSFDSYLASLPASRRYLNSISFVNIDGSITSHLIDTFTDLLQTKLKCTPPPFTTASRKNGHSRKDLSLPRQRRASKGAFEDQPYEEEQRKLGTSTSMEYKVTCCVCDHRLSRSSSRVKKTCNHDCCPGCVELRCKKCPATNKFSTSSSRRHEKSVVRPAEIGMQGGLDSMTSDDDETLQRIHEGPRKGDHATSDAATVAVSADIALLMSSETGAEKRDMVSSFIDQHGAEENCAICQEKISNPKVLPCKHRFCSECIDEAFSHACKCPCCGLVFGTLKGNQPEGGTMGVSRLPMDLEGFPKVGCIRIDYYIPSGIQKDDHPNPGHPHNSTKRTAYLPGNAEGEEILKLLRKAFDARLIFTVGRSNTTGQDDVVVWNDIHHKTSLSGTYGYPDSTYLSRVRQELAAKGLVSTDPIVAFTPVSSSRALPPKHAPASPSAATDAGRSRTYSSLSVGGLQRGSRQPSVAGRQFGSTTASNIAADTMSGSARNPGLRAGGTSPRPISVNKNSLKSTKSGQR